MGEPCSDLVPGPLLPSGVCSSSCVPAFPQPIETGKKLAIGKRPPFPPWASHASSPELSFIIGK